MFSTLHTETEFAGPLERIEFEAIGLALEAGGQSADEKQTRWTEYRQPELFDVGRSRIVTEVVEDRIVPGAHEQAFLGEDGIGAVGAGWWTRGTGGGRGSRNV